MRDCLSRLGCRSGRSAFVTEFCTGRGCQSDRARETGQVRRPPSHGPPLSRGARPRRGVGLLTASEGGRTGRSALSRRARGRLDSASPGARAGAASSRLAPLGRRRALGRDVPQARPPAGVHEARLKQRPPAAVSCVERRAHVHGWCPTLLWCTRSVRGASTAAALTRCMRLVPAATAGTPAGLGWSEWPCRLRSAGR